MPFCAAAGFACASGRAPAELVTLAPAVAITAAGMVAGFWWIWAIVWEGRGEVVGQEWWSEEEGVKREARREEGEVGEWAVCVLLVMMLSGLSRDGGRGHSEIRLVDGYRGWTMAYDLFSPKTAAR